VNASKLLLTNSSIISNSSIITITTPEHLAEVIIKVYGTEDLESYNNLLDRYLNNQHIRCWFIKKFEKEKPHLAFSWLGRWIQTSKSYDFKPYPIIIPTNISNKIISIHAEDTIKLMTDLKHTLLRVKKKQQFIKALCRITAPTTLETTTASSIASSKASSKASSTASSIASSTADDNLWMKDCDTICTTIIKNVTLFQFKQIRSVLQDFDDDLIGDLDNTVEELLSVSGMYADKLLPLLQFIEPDLSKEQKELFKKLSTNRMVISSKLKQKLITISTSTFPSTIPSVTTGVSDGVKQMITTTKTTTSSTKPRSNIPADSRSNLLSHMSSILNEEISKASKINVTDRVTAISHTRGLTFSYISGSVVPTPRFSNRVFFFDIIANMKIGTNPNPNPAAVAAITIQVDSSSINNSITGSENTVVNSESSIVDRVQSDRLDDTDRALKLGDKGDRSLYHHMKTFKTPQYDLIGNETSSSSDELNISISEYLSKESIKRRVMIQNLPPDITEEKLTQSLRNCGIVSRVWLFRENRIVSPLREKKAVAAAIREDGVRASSSSSSSSSSSDMKNEKLSDTSAVVIPHLLQSEEILNNTAHDDMDDDGDDDDDDEEEEDDDAVVAEHENDSFASFVDYVDKYSTPNSTFSTYMIKKRQQENLKKAQLKKSKRRKKSTSKLMALVRMMINMIIMVVISMVIVIMSRMILMMVTMIMVIIMMMIIVMIMIMIIDDDGDDVDDDD